MSLGLSRIKWPHIVTRADNNGDRAGSQAALKIGSDAPSGVKFVGLSIKDPGTRET